MTKFAAEIDVAYEHFMTLVEGTHPRTISKEHFSYIAEMFADKIERAVEAKYNSGERTPWTKDTDAKYVRALAEAKADSRLSGGGGVRHLGPLVVTILGGGGGSRLL